MFRYTYWNAHYFGENFYGWSIGDSQSLVESGPFHSQGRIGASNQPWQGSWRANVSVELVTCNPAGNRGAGGAIRSQSNFPGLNGLTHFQSFRLNPKNLEEVQRIRNREREMNILRNIQYGRQQGEGGNY